MLRRILIGLGALIVAIAAAGAELYFVQGLRPVFTGDMQYKGLSWGSDRKKHDAEIEASRTAQSTVQTTVQAPRTDRAVAAAPPAIIAPISYWTDFRGPHRDGVYS